MLVLGAGCGGSSNSSAKSGDITQQTITPGTLTIATGQPAYTPWVMDNKPESGKGMEAAVGYAVAEKMGFKKSQVKWVRTTFDSAIAPGSQKDWDMNIQQFGISKERAKAVDFTPSYFNADQAVIVLKDGKFADSNSVSGLKDAAIGAMVGTTSYDFATSKIKKDVKTYNDNATLAQALDSNQIDAIVVDTPTAVNIVKSGQVKRGKVIGRIPGSEDPEGDGIVLPKNSKLTAAATKAINTLQKDGTLDKLKNEWLQEYLVNVPELSK
ncbi:ABC transporter substrate-binding protein [Bifidobacterium sp. ESL0745]|uniref:ABC transporter substrate-binding protein n=1 Tax=Bifidobacterium sp. ESL0745 TaxID=2983226 RepID=UPI0023F93004|nr:ABC transporter substrate-binding protein [Bifidobacterium sp. ESL0745]MDF7665436.1 ABC transporter substrate-binding protein [Bifidobacterium sp. ESL0745]